MILMKCGAWANRKWCELQQNCCANKACVAGGSFAEVGISGALFFGSFLLDEQKKGTSPTQPFAIKFHQSFAELLAFEIIILYFYLLIIGKKPCRR
jgi:hypothetical protein